MRIKERPKETGGEGEGLMSYKERYRSTVVEVERYHGIKQSQTTKTMTLSTSNT